jgi:phage terminase small subunit
MANRSPALEKRASGKTGRRRLSPAEVALLSPGEQRRWHRRHDLATPPKAETRAGLSVASPAWLSPRQRALWRETVDHAPPGLLRPIDTPLLTAYVVQLSIFENAARHDAARAGPNAEDARLLRQTATSVAQLAAALCLTPVLRARVAAPSEPERPAPDDRWGELRRFPVINEGRAQRR